ncbi:chemotaxis protein CheW [Methylobacterium currus]|uniref:Chemotaxis protein CheW n=1 Tax=Methylobacterium currus TaxID=2051553 RepID=A0A2R4WF12_9HYPH|nr:chemotaxis protein CheW [Methylobacterium currus]AWB20132.1 chemotaxis protein CheW [Methylobacterium currus]UHC15126.1 chemotaxis protein CheW [Methylobacterium currus]
MPEAGRERFLVVALDEGGTRVALPAERVRALAPVPSLTRVPGAPASLAGLADRRGAALPVLDLARLLAPASDPVIPSRLLVAEAGEPVGLLVSRVVGLAADPGGAAILDLPGLVAGLRPPRSARSAEAEAGRSGAAPPPPRVALLALTVAGRSYALPLDAVEAVTRLPDTVAPAPGAGSLGAMPWRGRALPLVSLSARLGLGVTAGRRVAVLRGLGLAVEQVGPVLRVSPGAIDPVPRALRRDGSATDLAAGFVRLGDGALVCLLSPQALAGSAEEPPRKAPVAADLEPIVVVAVGGSAYGLPAGAVRRVQRAPDALTRLPRAPDGLAGMLAVRGGALPVLDLRRRLSLDEPGLDKPGLDEPEPSAPGNESWRRRLVVVEAGGVRAGLLVDGAARLVRPEAGAIRPVPAARDAALNRVADLPDGPLTLIDPAVLLSRASFAGRPTA